MVLLWLNCFDFFSIVLLHSCIVDWRWSSFCLHLCHCGGGSFTFLNDDIIKCLLAMTFLGLLRYYNK